MALRIITGPPGSGKTYYAVKHLYDNYFKDGKLQEGITVITNIDDLQFPHLSLANALSKVPVERFFTVDYQKKLLERYPKVLYVIDEAQQYFHRRFYDKDVFFFFQYHRHLGIDIYLITQSLSSIPKELRTLAECEIRAHRRSTTLLGEFRYTVLVAGYPSQNVAFPPDKKIFALYRSFQAEEIEPPKKSPARRLFVIALVAFLFSGLLFAKFLLGAFGSSRHKKRAPVVSSSSVTHPKKVEEVQGKPVKQALFDDSLPFQAPDPITVSVSEAVQKRVFVYCSFKVGRFCLLYTDSNGVNYKPEVINMNPDRFHVVNGLFVWLANKAGQADQGQDSGASDQSEREDPDLFKHKPVVAVRSYYLDGSGRWVER